MLKKETIEHLIQTYQGDNLAGWLSEVLDQDRRLHGRRIELLRKQEDLKEKHRLDRQGLQDEWDALRAKCPHHEVSFYGDAAGGNDSHRSCDLCGRDVRKCA